MRYIKYSVVNTNIGCYATVCDVITKLPGNHQHKQARAIRLLVFLKFLSV